MKRAGQLRMRAYAVTMLAVALGCGPAEAHLNATGMGPVYDGVMHFLTSPEDLVPALALALLAGLRGAACGTTGDVHAAGGLVAGQPGRT